MKLFEVLKKFDGSIHEVVRMIISEFFHQELDEMAIEEIVTSMSLSDILELDQAYTNRDVIKLADLLHINRHGIESPEGDVEESIFQQGRKPTSQASTRTPPRTGSTDKNVSYTQPDINVNMPEPGHNVNANEPPPPAAPNNQNVLVEPPEEQPQPRKPINPIKRENNVIDFDKAKQRRINRKGAGV